jgi:predicted ATPase
MDRQRCVVITGCSGSGKSALVRALGNCGQTVVAEAGRQIVRRQLAVGGTALPWTDPLGFVERAALLSTQQVDEALMKTKSGLIVTDRSVIDVVSYLSYCDVKTPDHLERLIAEQRYATTVLVTPPWREIFVSDRERPKLFEDALAEYQHVLQSYDAAGYGLLEIPHAAIGDRVSFVERVLTGLLGEVC